MDLIDDSRSWRQSEPTAAPCSRARRSALVAALYASLLCFGCLKLPERSAQSALAVDVSPPASFELEGKPFCFAGANNYYLASKPRPMVDDVLMAAKQLGFPVVRIWGFLDIGSLDGRVPHVDERGDAAGRKDGIYFQYFDPATGKVAYNEGPDGLPKLDYVLAKADQLSIKIILVLTNNWYDFGGMDQYLRWFGRTKHHEFYTAPEVRQTYKNWILQLTTRKNTENGRVYREDPTIFAWELANEPRCRGTGAGEPGWDNGTIVGWADEMSRYIESLAPDQMVSVGDEGFLDGGGEHWAYKAQDGVDHEALTALPGIDFGTYHSYPDDWGAGLAWGDRWIVDHERVARRLDKPAMLEEYGVKVTRDERGTIVGNLSRRLQAYEHWNDTALHSGASSTMIWMLGGLDTLHPAPSGLYHDYDGLTVFRGDETAALLSGIARRFSTGAPNCRVARPSNRAPSPFVRVRHGSELGSVSMGWASPGG